MSWLNQVDLRTPESVSLKFTLAGLGNRAYALLIDYTLWSIALTAFVIGWAVLSVRLLELLTPILSDRILGSLELWLFASYLLLSFAIYVGYFVLFEVWWQGQTPGKRWVNIRVICEDGRPARLPQALLRSLLRPIDDLFFLGVFLIILTPREKRLGDWLAGTLVIQEATTERKAEFEITSAAQTVSEELSILPTLEHLSPENFATIRAYLQRSKQMQRQARRTKARELAEQVQERLQLETLPADLPAEEFLQAVYLAYQTAYGERI
jgi:uncharacterized RDD family membrane protein YckC